MKCESAFPSPIRSSLLTCGVTSCLPLCQ
jgi:hypothetical protein